MEKIILDGSDKEALERIEQWLKDRPAADIKQETVPNDVTSQITPTNIEI
ncbi:MAG: hypothetical protein IJF54_00990 [Clostridia bacterium]|nr:hypothetical protein [Clostridia bacterium]